ncbi:MULTISPECIES: hypothetical protein [unclassified Aureimonas]|uniref:hypothetical protein n=1 Tax=unclassified Aureimonas TaxID=2615206 RepID=UPI0006FFE6B9|nr:MULTISPECIES: hypothetical protein [unclassified Aureimonas]KQT55317.1 hypothetical protein ASG62_10875 [Aureimonas sp. Leaf427]KQT71108.1 hypothetical protein ASG54_21260 [Aureimonas sp. Leaf460]
MRLTPAFALGLALAGPAAAQTAPSDAGAKALAEELAVYFGTSAFEAKVVTVAPEGPGYRITFAPNAAIAPLLEPGTKVEIAPYSILAAERSDGNWDVSSKDPISAVFDVTIEGQRQTGDYKFQAGTFTGVYSPKLGVFLSGTASIPGATITASDPASDVTATFGAIGSESTAREVAGGAVDADIRQTMTGLKETVAVKLDPEAGTERANVDVAVADITSATTMAGLKSRALLDLWAFAVARADKDAIVKDQEILRGLLGTALPLWSKIDGATAFNDVNVTSAFGSFSAKSAKVRLAMDGISTSSGLSYGFDLAGLSAQSPMMPGWAASLMPRDASVTMKLEGADIETPLKRVIAEFDLSKDPALPEETSTDLLAGLSENPPRLLIEKSRLTSRDLDLTFEGQFLFSAAQPESNVTIEAKGLDKVISTLQAEAAKDPSVNEVVGMLALAQGFAKPLPEGRSQWIVSAKSDGSVILNGNQIVAPTPEADELNVDTPPTPAPTDENALPTEDPATEGDEPAPKTP